MPSILIKEQDLTSAGGRATNYNVVYVPGFMSMDTTIDSTGKKSPAWPVEADKNNVKSINTTQAAKKFTPTLCSSVAEFEMYFGKRPLVLTNVDTSSGTTTYTVDKSYIYAKELLKMGLPVLYESVNDISDAESAADITMSTLYEALANDMLDKLVDKGAYQFKYLTTGAQSNFQAKGYPVGVVRDTITFKSAEDFVETNGENWFNALDDSLANNTYEFKYKGANKWDVTKFDGSKFIVGETKVETYECVGSTKRVKLADGNGAQKDTDIYVISNGNNDLLYITNKNFVFKNKPTTQSESTLIVGNDLVRVKFNNDSEVEFINFVGAKEFSVTQDATNVIATKMATVASNRGDCIALIDHSYNPSMTLQGSGSIFEQIKTFSANTLSDKADLCAAFTPWVNVEFTTYNFDAAETEDTSMPPSFAYLMALAQSLKTNMSWLAVAGATRGQIPNLKANKPLAINSNLTNSIAENEYQKRDDVSINGITDIKPFGYRIWGNRTLKNNGIEGDLTATSFLNIRNMICDVKKVVYDTCRRYTFEQNNDVLWLNFKAAIEPTLNQMKTGAGLSGYKIIKGETDKKAKLVAAIKLFPLYAVEDFDITVQMLDDEIEVS